MTDASAPAASPDTPRHALHASVRRVAIVVNPLGGAGAHARFIALKHPEAQAWRTALLEAGVITDVRDDTIRFGFGLYQDEADLERLIGVCRRLF